MDGGEGWLGKRGRGRGVVWGVVGGGGGGGGGVVVGCFLYGRVGWAVVTGRPMESCIFILQS